MRKYIFIAILALAGCDQFQEFDVPIEGHNVSPDRVVMMVEAEEVTVIEPNGLIRTTVTISVPKRGDIEGLDDRVTRVSVSFKNLRSGKLTEPVMCRAGAKIVIVAVYAVDDRDDDGGDVDCRSAW